MESNETDCKHESRILQERGFWKHWKCRVCGEWVDPPAGISGTLKPEAVKQ